MSNWKVILKNDNIYWPPRIKGWMSEKYGGMLMFRNEYWANMYDADAEEIILEFIAELPSEHGIRVGNYTWNDEEFPVGNDTANRQEVNE